MDENNEENKLTTILNVEEDKNNKSKIKQFADKFKKVPANREARLTAKVNFSKVDKDLQKKLKTWEKFGKKQIGDGALNFLIGNKARVRETKQVFAKLEATAKKSLAKYNAKLNELQGNDRDTKNEDTYGGKWGKTKDSLVNANKSIEENNKKLEELLQDRDRLLHEQKTLDLLPNEKNTRDRIIATQDAMIANDAAKADMANKSMLLGDTKAKIDAELKKSDEQGIELNKLAGAYFARTGDDSLWNALKDNIAESRKKNEAELSKINAEIQSLSGKKGYLSGKLNDARAEYVANPTNEGLEKVNELETRFDILQTQLSSLLKNKDVASAKISMDKSRAKQFREFYAKRFEPQDFDTSDYKTEGFKPKFDAATRKNNAAISNAISEMMKKSVSTPSQLRLFDDKQSQLGARKDMFSDSQINLGSTNEEIEHTQKEIEKINAAIQDTSNELKGNKKQAKELENAFEDIKNQCEEINKQIGLWDEDMKANPFTQVLKADDLKTINNTIDDINTRHQTFISLLRKSNVLTRLWSRTLINIRSQISDMFNPFTKFRMGFDAWLNRWDNLPWKNTFDVIAYNLVTAFAPVFEWLAKALIKIAQIANVFIMKWTGVNLFDKSAWQLEQIKKGMGQLTASFDELHSSNDNPNQFNTIFDTDPMAITPLSPELTEALEKWATRIGNAFKWIADNWMLLVGLWAAFKLSSGLISLLGWADKINTLFGKTLPFSLGTFLKGLLLVGGVVGTVYSGYKMYELGTKWDTMTDEEKDSNMSKSIGVGAIAGGLIGGVIGGVPGAMIGASIGTAITGGINSAIADYNGDDARAEITGAIGGAGIGAVIGTMIAPGIGTAVGAAIGGAVAWGGEKLGHWIVSNGGDYSNLRISTEDLAWANEQLAAAQDKAKESMQNLSYMEQLTGESGKALWDAVQNSSLSYDNMTASQMAVYDAYAQHLQILDTLHQAQQTQMDYETAMDMDRAKKTDNYSEYIQKMMQANKEGIYSNEELTDRFAQMYGELDRDSRKVFLEQLPENMREGVKLGGEEYLSNWSKFYDGVCTGWENFKTGWGTFWGDVGKTLSDKWNELKTKASEAWTNIKDTIINSAKGAWENAKGFFANIAEKVKETWASLKKLASETGQKIGNYVSGNGWKTDAEIAGSTGSEVIYDPNDENFDPQAWDPKRNKMYEFAVGTNYVPNDQLAYVHQGEAIIPKKYNKPYQPPSTNSNLENTISAMTQEIANLRTMIQGGIPVKGEFKQRGADLVAIVEKGRTRNGNQPLSNPAYAR